MKFSGLAPLHMSPDAPFWDRLNQATESDTGPERELLADGPATQLTQTDPARFREDQVVPIAPPNDAPYLQGEASLPDELLAEMGGKKRLMRPLDDRAQAMIDTLKARIRFRREAYEREHGVLIIPERPAV